ncbi:MAG: response regulator [Nitrospinaceae bacterium]|jgi:putative two-component system response regulator|nr:response regulator [Nitrospinaceae bacterium]MBT3432387.1 response regulator [Nitrospinaceae bacterium]MBT3820992.1 response regulator [Nitrospinaceae bacterium]MBT4093366.1 response regulator [Nitrospinaceae bacterium]MBT4432220.1 response regulator [Nitrospinaceae bacterium]
MKALINVDSSSVDSTKQKGEECGYSVMIVDDEKDVRESLGNYLERKGFEVSSLSSADEAVLQLTEAQPHLIISDQKMPGMSGIDFLAHASEKYPLIPRILCTGHTDLRLALEAVNRGSVNRILTKPFDLRNLMTAVEECLEQVRLRERNEELLRLTREQNEKLEETNQKNAELLLLADVHNQKLDSWNQSLKVEVAARTAYLDEMTEAAIYSLAELAESRARDIGGHLRRMQEYARIIAEALMVDEKRRPHFLVKEYVDDLCLSTLLHDVGKVGIPDGILFKPGRLEPEEYAVMKTHARIGLETVKKAQSHIGDESFLSLGVDITGHHHEFWDGNGYPSGLVGEKIPFSARIVAIADVYDALTSPRVYKKAWSHEETLKYMLNGAGTQFDPLLIEVLEEQSEGFQKVRDTWEE